MFYVAFSVVGDGGVGVVVVVVVAAVVAVIVGVVVDDDDDGDDDDGDDDDDVDVVIIVVCWIDLRWIGALSYREMNAHFSPLFFLPQPTEDQCDNDDDDNCNDNKAEKAVAGMGH